MKNNTTIYKYRFIFLSKLKLALSLIRVGAM